MSRPTLRATITSLTATPAQRTYLYGSLGFTVATVAASAGYGLLAWSVWRWLGLTTELVVGGGIAAVLLPAGGAVLGRAITTGRPQDERIFAVSAGVAIGSTCLLVGSVAYLALITFDNL
ncbi:hypothetical protein [Nonomuraea sp. NPDC050643]|uniref:hypothetical protein n=1 Tax=Nonomuraea sp. NPDC050643 TaxID=3155660 RepID=UPI0033D9129A